MSDRPKRSRTIFHVDMDGFFAAVETLFHPEVIGKPMAVCGDPEKRHGIILAKNQLAKDAGVKTAEPIWQARRVCPDLILLPPHRELYTEYCDKANAIYARYTDRVEVAGIDESYLDVTGCLGGYATGAEAADAIRDAIRGELGLTVSVGVSFCKIFAKIGSDLKKPDSTNVITEENFRKMLYPLPVGTMMYVGRHSAEELARIGIHTIGELAALDEDALTMCLGRRGETLYRYVRGLDADPVVRAEEAEDVKSVGNSMTFTRDLITIQDISLGLRTLAESVAYRLRCHGKKCRGVQISIKDTQLHVIDRQTRLDEPTNLTRVLYTASVELVRKSWKIGRPIRLLAVTAIDLTDESEGGQLSMFGDGEDTRRREALERSLDALKEKYGDAVIKPASAIGNDLGL
jgi:DNA polymerase-4